MAGKRGRPVSRGGPARGRGSGRAGDRGRAGGRAPASNVKVSATGAGTIRPLPEKMRFSSKQFQLCKKFPLPQGCSFKDCTFAHGEAERVAWEKERRQSATLRKKQQAQAKAKNNGTGSPQRKAQPWQKDARAPGNHSATSSASGDIVTFHQRLLKLDRRSGGKKTVVSNLLEQSDMKDLWFRTWTAAAAGALSPVLVLLKTLLALPAKVTMLPPVKDVIPVLIMICEDAQKMKVAEASEALNLLEMVVDCICSRLRNLNAGPLHFSEELQAHLNTLPDALRQSAASWYAKANQPKRCADLMKTIEDGVVPFQHEAVARMKAAGEPAEDRNHAYKMLSTAQSWKGWQKPHLHWLLDGAYDWLAAPPLQRKYESVMEYSETLQRMMTMLAFYWGAGAVWPKCRKNDRADSEHSCNEPILTPAKGRNVLKCCMCAAPARWRCPQSRHMYGMCNECVKKDHRRQTGARGPGSSTDLYDAKVERESTRREGQVYMLTEVESRRPPRIAPNWRTSYRLQCSGLVAVINLDTSLEALRPEQEIYWAQIVPFDENDMKGDAQCRSRGQMAVRLLNRGDLGVLDQQATPLLEVGARVAIVDLRVFVPEVVPVLAACCDPALADDLRQIPFSQQLIGNDSNACIDVLGGSVPEVIANTIHQSNIEVIRRLSPSSQTKLTRDLTNITTKANLRGAQLDAFASALSNSVHCTQGPPGTGKSYVGVQLVFALDRIRAEAIAAGHHVGPIMVLSYKNHALDEILLDVLDGLPSRGTAVFTKDLIRCGNPEDERLRQYKEKRSPVEAKAERELSRCLSTLRRGRHFATSWIDLSTYLEMSLLAFSGSSDSSGMDLLGAWDATGAPPGVNNAVDAVVCAVELLQQLVSLDAIAEGNLTGVDDCRKAYTLLQTLQEPESGDCSVSLLALISELNESSQYWTDDRTVPKRGSGRNRKRLYFLVTAWLFGRNPPPLCKAATEKLQPGENACNLPTFTFSPYCKVHACCSIGCDARRLDENRPYCQQHCCSSEGCIQKRLEEFSFCQAHLCTICFSLELTPGNLRCMRTTICVEHMCSVEGCNRRRNGCPQFCKRHSCQMCVESGISTQVDPICPQSRLCRDHRCSHPVVCPRVRLVTSNFCDVHSCRFCLALGEATEPVNEHPPRNTCATHVLCNFMYRNGQQCNELSVDGLYCSNHQTRALVSITCAGKTKKNKPCKAKSNAPQGSGKWYCAAHQDQASEVSEDEQMEIDGSDVSSQSDESDAEDFDLSSVLAGEDESSGDDEFEDAISHEANVMCAGVTRKNKPCKTRGTASAGNVWFCPAHKDQEASVMVKMPMNAELGRLRLEREDRLASPAPDPPAQGIVTESTALSLAAVSSQVRLPNMTRDDVEPEPEPEIIYSPLQGPVLACASTALNRENVLMTMDICMCTEYLAKRELEVESDAHAAIELIIAEDTRLAQPGALTIMPERELEPEPGLNTEQSTKPEPELETDLTEIKNHEHAEFVDADFFDPDEMHYDNEEIEEEDINLDQQRLHDMLGSSSEEESEEEEITFTERACDLARTGNLTTESLAKKLSAWSWDMSLQDRLASAAAFLNGMSAVTRELRMVAEEQLEKARRDQAEAAAEAFQSARVVGATVAGAAKRLKALRAAEPFAVIVEEACEVMEPLLMSIVSLRSLKKLELIGDHRQLPAFVQSCWFNLEKTHGSIKVSLFERLVESPSEIVPCHVLDEQRRMRPEISDLTRGHYADVVDIKDNICTVKQKIGDVFGKANPAQRKEFGVCRKLWDSGGKHVPGVLPGVFFWELPNNRESRPIAGLSACNEREADAVAALVRWFLACGVPPPAITVITPYKGQQRMVLRKLRSVPGALAKRQYGVDSEPGRRRERGRGRGNGAARVG